MSSARGPRGCSAAGVPLNRGQPDPRAERHVHRAPDGARPGDGHPARPARPRRRADRPLARRRGVPHAIWTDRRCASCGHCGVENDRDAVTAAVLAEWLESQAGPRRLGRDPENAVRPGQSMAVDPAGLRSHAPRARVGLGDDCHAFGARARERPGTARIARGVDAARPAAGTPAGARLRRAGGHLGRPAAAGHPSSPSWWRSIPGADGALRRRLDGAARASRRGLRDRQRLAARRARGGRRGA